ncbi:uncharacterized protein LOC127902516 isoform X2 [Citrus sinensis]|uniref:uncharacterized protein LOC127902516 isoform X2 n=1 Tax=Citrus sinensis TaxID=2711 RepID=UPI0022783886|nr:uncharacterized protein LOC127902516 isoform X2 [Citrus sinensis]
MASSECRLLSALEATVTQSRTRQWKYLNLKLLQSEGQTEACHCIFFNLRLKTWCTMFKCRCGLAASVWISVVLRLYHVWKHNAQCHESQNATKRGPNDRHEGKLQYRGKC